MSATLEYKGYSGTPLYSTEDKVFFGKLEGIRATVTFEGSDPESLERSFRDSVDDYLALCKQEGLEPEKPYKGTFNVRVSQELHREVASYARKQGTNLNSVVKTALEAYLNRKSV